MCMPLLLSIFHIIKWLTERTNQYSDAAIGEGKDMQRKKNPVKKAASKSSWISHV